MSKGPYFKSNLELKSNSSEILPVNCKFICVHIFSAIKVLLSTSSLSFVSLSWRRITDKFANNWQNFARIQFQLKFAFALFLKNWKISKRLACLRRFPSRLPCFRRFSFRLLCLRRLGDLLSDPIFQAFGLYQKSPTEKVCFFWKEKFWFIMRACICSVTFLIVRYRLTPVARELF